MTRSLKIRIGWFLTTLIFITLSGCKKGDQYYVAGIVKDPNQGIDVAGVSVEVWTQRIKSGVFEADYKLAGQQTTGEDGKFQFELESASYTGVKLIFSRDGYFGWEAPVNVAALTKEPGQYTQYQMLPKAWILFHIYNRDPFDSADYFEYRLLNAYSDCDECCQEELNQFYGMEVDQNVRCISAGYQDLVVQWSKRKNKEQVFNTESFFIKAGDTTRIELIY
jgi:hypothetical protein